ncbi:hypothetical protein [Nibricoccus sp. IMCC34717]|uniref:hypothetical protein n=1 Tax=Nibricoccus sp. IMCC34717 TaxID=3034021 RepID=UPI00384EFA31
MSDTTPSASSRSSFWITLLAVIGGFAIFLLILVVAYLPQKPGPLPEGQRTPAERAALLAELRGKEKTAATNYGWVDQSAGVVRLPIDRAVELTLVDINAKR